jgi:type IV secretory pathway VirB10-like protein
VASEALDHTKVTSVVEHYFSSFLDDIYAQTYPTMPPEPPTPAESVPEPNAALLAKLGLFQAELERQRQELEALKKRPAGTTIVPPPQAAKVTPPPKANASMLFVAHALQDPPAPPKATEYTLAPGATKLPCIVETAINSAVEGYFTAKVATNVYDTATGRHLLVPQGSTVLGHDQSSVLRYGNERLPTLSLALALPDGRSVDLGQAPVTDQQGIAGLTGRVNQHWWRLFGAVFIGGALQGGCRRCNSAPPRPGQRARWQVASAPRAPRSPSNTSGRRSIRGRRSR